MTNKLDSCAEKSDTDSFSSSSDINKVIHITSANELGETSSNNVKINKLNCLYTNARSIVNKLDELHLYLSEEKPDIVGITETWLNSSIDNSELNVDGYTIFRRDRDSNSKQRGGGVLLLIKEQFNADLRDDLYDTDFPECIWCNVEFSKLNILVGVCYRPPNTDPRCNEALIDLINKACKHEVLILGDFNFPLSR